MIWSTVLEIWSATECNKLVIMEHFLPFYTPPPPTVLLKTQDIRILKKWKQLLEISSFYTSVPKTTITWGMVPEMWSETYRIFFRAIFCPFSPPPPKKNNPENQNFENTKKVSREVIILHMCTKKSQSYYVCLVRFLRYGVWQI